MFREKFEHGLNLLNQAEFDEAIEVFSEIAVDCSDNYDVWINLGVCYLETQRPDLAVEAFERATKADPDQSNAYYLLGTAMGVSGDLDKALELYKKAVEIEPLHQKAQEFLSKTEALIESREHYRNALKLLSSENKSISSINLSIREFLYSMSIFQNSPARHNLGQIIDEILDTKKEGVLNIDIIKEENRLWAKSCEKGFRFLKKGPWESAISYYSDALSYRDQDAFVHHSLGIAFFKVGATGDAVKAFLRVLELDPDYDFTTLMNLPKFE
jgi:tetratricopeptide (TPR) repeat protein